MPSIFIVTSILAIAYTFQPGTLKEFRYKKAVEMCKEAGSVNGSLVNNSCETTVDQMNAVAIMDFIRDDEPAQVRTNGGNFVNGNMNP